MRPPTALVLAATIALATPALYAHTRLDSPNGGEVLRIGSKFTIQWTELVPHRVMNWDLYYSLTGANGPWFPLALDLPPASRSYEWVVQTNSAVLTTHVRVRVVQDMNTYTYEDISDGDLTIMPSMSADTAAVSLSKGGTQTMTIDAGNTLGGAFYAVLGTASGTTPGLTYEGFPLALNPDGYFLQTIGLPNTAPLSMSAGTLDASGRVKLQFSLPPGLPPGLQGLVLHHAALVGTFQTVTLTVELASNPVSVQLGS